MAVDESQFLSTMSGYFKPRHDWREATGRRVTVAIVDSGIMIAAIFIISDRFSTVFATKGNLHPFIAAWLPNIVFTFVAVWLYRRTPK